MISQLLRALSLFRPFFAGLLLAFSGSPWNRWFLAIAGLGLLFRTIEKKPWRYRFLCGWVAGIALFGISLFWTRQFNVAGSALLVTFEALFIGAACALVPAVGRQRGWIFIAAFTLSEAARIRWPFGGLPMGGITTGQASGPLAEAVRIVGEPGLATVLALIAVGMSRRPWLRRSQTGRRWPAFIVAIAIVVAGHLVSNNSTATLNVAAVQGGGVQALTREQQDAQRVFLAHINSTSNVQSPVDLIVWPENVIDVRGPVAASVHSETMASLARFHNAPVVSGVVETQPDLRFRNAVVVWNADGTIGSRYEKVHRVPFGEYVPFRAAIDRVADLSQVPRDAVKGSDPAVVEFAGHRAGVVVSFEGLFAERARSAIRAGGEVLLVPTNASSYKSPNVAKAQVQAARLRALETGRWVVQASPTGISAIVNDDGEVEAKSTIGPPAVLQETVELSQSTTPYMRWGDAPLLLAAAATLGALLYRSRRVED